MKKIVLCLTVAVLALFSFCGCGAGNKENEDEIRDKSYRYGGTVDELLSVEELFDFYINGNKFPENFVFEELDGYGRVIDSASSLDEAHKTVEKNFTSGFCKTVENRLVVETELFYGIYVKWSYMEDYFYDEYVVSFKSDVYDAETKKFGTNDADMIKKIINYVYYSKMYKIGGSKVYSSDICRKDGYFEYLIYYIATIGGDWDMPDNTYLMKEIIKIDADTGEELDKSREEIGCISIYS